MGSRPDERYDEERLVYIRVGFPPEVLERIRERAESIDVRLEYFVAAATERYLEMVYPNADPTLEMFDVGDPAERGVYREQPTEG